LRECRGNLTLCVSHSPRKFARKATEFCKNWRDQRIGCKGQETPQWAFVCNMRLKVWPEDA